MARRVMASPGSQNIATTALRTTIPADANQNTRILLDRIHVG
jgi:hypothetical protein